MLTSNRDEKLLRATAVHPQAYPFESGKIMFPKDADAGGTWVAVHENGNAVVLLNGGLVKHIPSPPYRKSRGLVLLEIMNTEQPYVSFLKTDLDNIEPFTLIIHDDGLLYECRWDGNLKHTKELDATKPHIWSSVTLYTPEVIAKREQWFHSWLDKNPNPDQDDVLHFHQFTGDGDLNNDLMMNRNGETFTVSITSFKLGKLQTEARYLDLKNKTTWNTTFGTRQNTLSLK